MIIVYFTTEKMVTDYSSKPLKGKLYVVHRNNMKGMLEKDVKWHNRCYKEVL